MAQINAVTDLSQEGEVAVITVDSPPVNALGHDVRVGMVEAFRQADADPAIRAIVLICAGKTFFAGADIVEFSKGMAPPLLPEVLTHIEASTKPVVAAIHGTALGGGLETALAANWRVAVPSAKLGLPEVHLGLIPGAGGTQRLPRLLGVEAALDIIASGKQTPAKTAAEIGLIDALAPEDGLRAFAIDFAKSKVGQPLRKIRDMDDKLAPLRGKPEVFDGIRKAGAKKFRGLAAPELALQAVQAAVEQPFDQGLQTEAGLFLKSLMSPQSAAQRYYFFAERAAAKIPDVPEETPTRPIKAAGVMGAGTMGGGITMALVNGGIPVTIVEMVQENLDRGLATIRKNYERTAARGGMTAEDVDKRMGMITGSLDYAALKDADLVIEAVFERMDIKKQVFAKLDEVCKPGAILASNTSFLDLNEIAQATKRPGDVIGLHFFSPANVMRLLEIVRGDKTEKDVIATAMKVGRQMGKVSVLVGVALGFVGNRILVPRQVQAEKLTLEGVMPWDVDKVFFDFGFPMGPFAMGDLAGLDIWLEDKQGPDTLRDVMVAQGRKGQKTGGGYYDYDADRNAKPSPVTEAAIKELMARYGTTARKVSDEEIFERCVLPMINEGAKILEEGKATRPSDIDVVWVNGYGWPVYQGGPMYYADQLGLPKVVEKLKAYQASLKDDMFKPCALLEKLAAEGKTFASLNR